MATTLEYAKLSLEVYPTDDLTGNPGEPLGWKIIERPLDSQIESGFYATKGVGDK